MLTLRRLPDNILHLHHVRVVELGFGFGSCLVFLFPSGLISAPQNYPHIDPKAQPQSPGTETHPGGLVHDRLGFPFSSPGL